MKTIETKRIPTVACEINGLTLSLAFSDGTTAQLDASTLTEEIQQRAMMHGLKQKLIDAAAMSCDPETGRPASVADKIAAIIDVRARLLAGEWNKNREGGGSGNAGGLLLRALVELYPAKTRDELRAFIDGKSKEQQAALRATPKIAAVIDRLRALKDASAAEGLLDELE